MRRPALILIGISSLVACMAIGTAVSFAAFVSSKKEIVEVAIKGNRGKTLFFEPKIWEVDKPEFCLYAWNSSDDTKNAWLKSVNKNNLEYYVFEVDNLTFDKCIFVRMDPEHATQADFVENNDYVWNKTYDLDIPTDTKNKYSITNWGDWDSEHSRWYKECTGSWGTFPDS